MARPRPQLIEAAVGSAESPLPAASKAMPRRTGLARTTTLMERAVAAQGDQHGRGARRPNASLLAAQQPSIGRVRSRTQTENSCGQASNNETGTMQQALQATLARIQEDVESLSNTARPRKTGKDKEEEEKAAAEDEAKRAEQAESLRQAKRAEAETKMARKVAPKPVKVISSQPQRKLVIDRPQESSDDTDDEGSEREASEHPESNKSSSSSDAEPEADESVLFKRRASLLEEDDTVEDWHPDASALLQQLLQSINLEERTEMLEDLENYYSRKQKLLEDEDRQLDDIEVELSGENRRREKDSADVKQSVDAHEASVNKALRRYDDGLRTLAAAPTKLPQRLEDIKMGLIKAQGMGMEDVELGPSEVLTVITNLQEQMAALTTCVDLQESRVKSFKHAEKVLTEAAKLATDAPLHDEITCQVVKEVCKIRNAESIDSDSPVDEDVFEHCARLTRECDELRQRIARERERGELLGDQGVSEMAAVMRRKVWRRNMLRKTTKTFAKVEKERPPWESLELFGLDLQHQYEAELERVKTACEHTEQLINTFQEIQAFSGTSVPALEEGVRKLTEAAQQAKKNVSVGRLPEEEDSEEALIRDLKEANHEITLKQEADHSSQMLKLEALEGRILQDVRSAEEKVRMLEWALNREDEKTELMKKEMVVRKEQLTMARQKLENMQALPFEEEQAAHARFLEKAYKLTEQRQVAHDRMLIALRKSEMTMKTFKTARSLGADVASNAAWKQLESGGPHYEALEDTTMASWWALVSEINHEDPLQEEHVDQLVTVLRQEEETGAPSSLMRDRTSVVEVQRTKLQAQSTSDRLAELMAAADDDSAAPVPKDVAASARRLRAIAAQRRKKSKDLTSSRRQSREKGDKGEKEGPRVVRVRSRSKRLRSAMSASVVPKLMHARQRVRTKELLQEAKQDQEQAEELHARTEELCRAGAALEAKAVQFLRLRGKTQLPAELKVSFNLDEIQDDGVDDPKIEALHKEVRARQAEFDLLSAKMRDLRTIARRGGKSILKSGKPTDDLRSEVIGLCDSALKVARKSTIASRESTIASLHRLDTAGGVAAADAADADEET